MSPSAIPAPKHYQVAIVGGGIAGLTLALAFERMNISFALFEAHESLAPSLGASIGLLPNGLRILEQLGVLHEIEQNSVALQRWRHVDGDGKLIASTNALGYYPSKIGYGGMSASFACVYGISLPTPGIAEGDCFSVYRQHASILGFTGKGGVVFWFVFEDLGRAYPLSEAPRYDDTDADGVCLSVAHLEINSGIRFQDIYANRTVAKKIVLEEGMTKTWHSDRTVIVGDAAHKMVPNAAMGANQAMESSVILANELRDVLAASADNQFHPEALKSALARYAERRTGRTTEVMQKAGMICRAQLCHSGPPEAVLKELPSLSDGDWLFRGFMGLADAPVLHGIPLTDRGRMYQQAVEALRTKAKARQREGLKLTNSALFGLEEETV
ncbi:hypothetical protein ACJZ2D_010025 [Fusarium nematophilum]